MSGLFESFPPSLIASSYKIENFFHWLFGNSVLIIGVVGTLYIVSTPIGNLGDITYRAVQTLSMCDLVVCEDSRVTSKLLQTYNIKKRMVVLNEFNEEERVYDVIEALLSGENVALVSDSGTPLISDPGYKLVSQSHANNICVVPVPGPTAAIAALSASGLPTHNFLFLGFLPKKLGKRKNYLMEVQQGLNQFATTGMHPTVILYESPHRLVKTLEIIEEMFGDIPLVVAREMTKMHEEIARKRVGAMVQHYREKGVKGEVCLLFSLKN